MVEYAHKHNAYGILANDSDFIMMNAPRYLSLHHLRWVTTVLHCMSNTHTTTTTAWCYVAYNNIQSLEYIKVNNRFSYGSLGICITWIRFIAYCSELTEHQCAWMRLFSTLVDVLCKRLSNILFVPLRFKMKAASGYWKSFYCLRVIFYMCHVLCPLCV